MLRKTKGIVISFIKYKESSIIVKIFTRELGLRAFVVNGVRSKSSKQKMAIYQPLTQLDLVVYFKENQNISRISEARVSAGYHKIPFDFTRSAIGMFMGEVLTKSIYEGYQNESFFDFLENSLCLLDSESSSLSHFPMAFLFESSRYLGFAPTSAELFFGELLEWQPNTYWDKEQKDYLNQIIENSFRFSGKIPGEAKRALLDHFLEFYGKHLDLSSDWKSVKVLRQMLS